MPKTSKATVAAQRKSLRTLRKDFLKRKADLRNIVKTKKSALVQVRADIKHLEEEIKKENEELSVEFDSGSSCFSSSDSESSSASNSSDASKKKASPKGKARADGTIRKAKPRNKLPFLPPGAPAPNHRGWPNSEGVRYPGFVEDDPRHCAACEQLRRGFLSATKAHRPTDMPCPWAPRSKGS